MHLNNAPIREALIDVRAALPADAGLALLDSVDDRMRAAFPERKTIHQGRFQVNFDFKEGASETSAEHGALGVRYESQDGKRIVQFRLNGYTYSRLAPYTNWDEMRDEAREFWQIYSSAMSPVAVSRVATRFINMIRIPMPINDFEDWLTQPPRIPKDLPQALAGYLLRIVLPDPDTGATSIITQALEEVGPQYASVVLDIDVFLNRDSGDADGSIWDQLEQLRTLKNKIFFASVTDRTLELCR